MNPRALRDIIKTTMERGETTLPTSAIVYSKDGEQISIRFLGSPSIIRGVPVVGDATTLSVGQTVRLQWSQDAGSASPTPYVITGGMSAQNTIEGNSGVITDNETIELSTVGLRVKAKGLTLGHLSFAPAIEGHTHDDPFTRGGWQVLDDGTIFNGLTYIHPSGQISIGSGNNIVKLDALNGTYRIWVGAVLPENAPFAVSQTGAITSTSGVIGGWSITSTKIYKGSLELDSSVPRIAVGSEIILDGANATYRLWSGNSDPASAPFSVSKTGSVKATSGTIGGWTLSATKLTSGNLELDSSVPQIKLASDMLISASGPKLLAGSASAYLTGTGIFLGKETLYKVHIGDPTAQYLAWDGSALTIKGTLQSTNYSTGVAGWRITYDGDAEFANVVVRGEIRTAVFVKSEISVVAGSMFLAKSSAILSADVSVPGSGTWNITVKASAAPFASSDVVRTKDGSNDTWATVGAPTDNGNGTYTYTCTYQSGTRPCSLKEGLLVLDYGQSGDGFLWLTADDANGPFYSVRTHAGSPWTTQTERARLGNLNGNWGYNSKIFGVALGQYAADKTSIAIDDTNGLRIMNSGGVLGQWDAAGVITVGKTGASQSNVYISSGGVQLRTNTTVHIDLQSDGDVFIGEDTSAAASTNISIFTAAQTYNSESVSAGDMLIGDNSSNKANILWDKSAGQLLFRSGTATRSYIHTDGSIIAGGGNVKLNQDGIIIAPAIGGAWGGTSAVNFKDGSTQLGYLASYKTGGSNQNWVLELCASVNAGNASDLYLTAPNSQLKINSTPNMAYIVSSTQVFTVDATEVSIDIPIKLKDISAPSTPGSGYGRLYINSDRLRFINDGGVDLALSGDYSYAKTEANYTHSSTGNWVAIPLTAETYDVGGLHSTLSNNTRMTVSVTGNYIIVGKLTWASNSTGARAIGIRVDGSTFIATLSDLPNTGGSHGQHICTVARLTANQYVELCGFQSSGGNLDVLYASDYTAGLIVMQIG